MEKLNKNYTFTLTANTSCYRVAHVRIQSVLVLVCRKEFLTNICHYAMCNSFI